MEILGLHFISRTQVKSISVNLSNEQNFEESLNPLYSNGFFLLVRYNSPLYISRGVSIYFLNNSVFICLTIFFYFYKQCDEMQHFAHLVKVLV